MTDSSLIARRKATLRARGVPEKFIDAIATRKNGALVSLLLVLVFVMPLFGLIFGSFVFSGPLTAWLDKARDPLLLDSLLVYHTSAASSVALATALPWVFVMFFASDALQRWRTRPWPAFSIIGNRLRSDASGRAPEAITRDADYAKLADLPDDTAFLNALRPSKTSAGNRFMTAWMFLTFVPVIVAAGYLAIDGAASYNVLRTDTFEVHSLSDTQTHRIADARLAYVLCRGIGYRFDYRVRWPDTTVSLWEASDPLHHLDERQVIERLNTIDSTLARDHIRVDRMPPSPEAEACVAAMAKGWPQADRARLHRLVFGR